MAIRGYRGNLPAQCNICLEDGNRASSLIQTTCCRASSAAQSVIIPRTYHRGCLKRWADTLNVEEFPCINCHKILPKSALLSRVERIKQCFNFKVMAAGFSTFLSLGSMAGCLASLEKANKIEFLGYSSLFFFLSVTSLSSWLLITYMNKVDIRIKEYMRTFVLLNFAPSLVGGVSSFVFSKILQENSSMFRPLIYFCIFSSIINCGLIKGISNSDLGFISDDSSDESD